MKNIHKINQNIYITSDVEIKEGDWFLNTKSKAIGQHNGSKILLFKDDKKIILTTDADLIKDGVQAIDDEFLEWFVKNPSCERVEVLKQGVKTKHNQWGFTWKYFIKIPKEEPKQDFPMQKLIDIMENDEELRPKQETLEEAAEKEFPLIDTEWCRTGACEEENLHLLGHRRSFIKGAKWQQEQDKNKYSEEDMRIAFNVGFNVGYNDETSPSYLTFEKWINGFKKK